MNPKLAAKHMEELAEDVANMDDENQEKFAALLPMMAKLFRRDAQVKCVMLMSDETHTTLVRINADEYEAHRLIVDALPKHTEVLMRGAPAQGDLH